jgi:hypothetical protein
MATNKSKDMNTTPAQTTEPVDLENASVNPAANEQLQGRAVFSVETTAVGIAVTTGFLSVDGRFFNMPAVFPSQSYALEQIDELRRLLIQHFAQAAQVGAQVIAAQAAQSTQAGQAATVESVASGNAEQGVA